MAAARPRGQSNSRAELASILADRFDARRLVLTGSGTQALSLAIRTAISVTGSPVVALPGFCCYDVGSAAVGANARVALYDIDPSTLTPDPESIERVLAESGAKILVIAHLYGFPSDWEKLEAIAKRFGATLIEDAAQGHGGSWRGRPLGALGGLSVLSFGRGKGWTGAGGGALLLRDGWESGQPISSLSDSGAAWKILAGGLAHWLMGRPSIYGLPSSLPWLGLGETRYHPPVEPVGMNPTSAAVALRSSAASDVEAHSRQAAAALLGGQLRTHTIAREIDILEGGTPGYLRLPIRVPRGLDSFPSPATALRAGVGRSYPTTLDALPVIVERLVSTPDLPGGRTLARELVTLPVHSMVRDDEKDGIISLLQGVRA